jgi:glycosyltransferase involved in cell wall biosynthesis
MKFAHLKDRLVEFVKFDHNDKKGILVVGVRVAAFMLWHMGARHKAFQLVSAVFRTGWSGSYSLGVQYAKQYFVNGQQYNDEIQDAFIASVEPLSNTAEFFTAPQKMLNGIITVLKKPNGAEKGVIIINYSYYFPLFLRFFNAEDIFTKYHLILEPSWAGFCESNILIYTQLNVPIFIQTYEERDYNFVNALDSNLIPIKVGPSWFINYKNFAPPAPDQQRDIDLIVVAAWAKYKRHRALFSALKGVVLKKPDFRIVLVGYPGDMSQNDILTYADEMGLANNVKIYEWITPQEVADLYKRAKINVLWSKFEGNNRAIIEGMLCDTPVIMRENHNYGEKYDFINAQTGYFANEQTLESKVFGLLSDTTTFTPRDYILNNRNCDVATQIMQTAIKNYELKHNSNPEWHADLAVKVNDLHGMHYLYEELNAYDDCYSWIEKKLK